jgi:hypothetical protein
MVFIPPLGLTFNHTTDKLALYSTIGLKLYESPRKLRNLLAFYETRTVKIDRQSIPFRVCRSQSVISHCIHFKIHLDKIPLPATKHLYSRCDFLPTDFGTKIHYTFLISPREKETKFHTNKKLMIINYNYISMCDFKFYRHLIL